MARREYQEDNWAEQVPWTRPRTPYRSYGWERHQSGLPEFRDPSSHFMPYEQDEIRPWRRMRPMGEDPLSGWNLPGPYAGIGPRGYQRSNESIYEDVCQRLTWNGQLDASEIEVEVDNGEVTLKGTVDSRGAKRMAEDTVESVSGVRDVHNHLRIQKRQEVPDRWVDRVGQTGIYPASGPPAPEGAEVQTMAEWGQGERGAEGYYDHGESELRIGRTEGDEE